MWRCVISKAVERKEDGAEGSAREEREEERSERQDSEQKEREEQQGRGAHREDKNSGKEKNGKE